MSLEYATGRAVQSLKKILERERNPRIASEVPHTYEDKYILANWATSSAAQASLNALDVLGLNETILRDIKKTSDVERSSAFLVFEHNDTCTYLREEIKKVESDSEVVTTKTSVLGTKSKTSTGIVTKIHEHYWKFISTWKIFVSTGSVSHEVISRTIEQELVVVGDKNRAPASQSNSGSKRLLLDWLIKVVELAPPNDNGLTFNVSFEIDRSEEKECKTPRRNRDVEDAYNFFWNITSWADFLNTYFTNILRDENGLRSFHKMAPIATSFYENQPDDFIPGGPLMEEVSKFHQEENNGSPARILGTVKSDMEKMSSLHKSDLLNRLNVAISSVTSPIDCKKKGPTVEMITAEEARVLVVLSGWKKVGQQHRQNIDYIESMLYQQLKDAIGKDISNQDFIDYMKYHHTKIFSEEYRPKPFCYAIRRPDHFPEGVLSIESRNRDEAITTSVRSSENGPALTFPLNAATTVSLNGPRYLHASVQHSFNNSKNPLSIVTRARQFSSFILMIGTLSGKNSFEPKHAIIIKDKDDLKLPLLLETIPSAKEFKAAIESLSPEQQRFANQFRGMQLASTLFAMAVVQIKPQLEKLLNLPNDSLTKEIKLTQQLMDLFIEYQISSDLISYDENFVMPSETNETAALNQVKHHVQNMNEMIKEMKGETIKQSAASYVNDLYDNVPRPPSSIKMMSQSNSRVSRSCVSDVFSAPPPSACAMPAPPPSACAMSAQPPPGGAPAPVSAPVAPQNIPPENKNKPQEAEFEHDDTTAPVSDTDQDSDDFTLLPKILEQKYEKIEEKGAPLRPTIIKIGSEWSREQQKSILSKKETHSLSSDSQKTEKNKAFDLLDALSKSGALSIDSSELHVVIAATHCFEKTLIDTVIQGNKNPIEKIEASMLMVAATVHNKDVKDIANPKELDRITQYSPKIFEDI